MKKNLAFRSWFYFRQGWSTYFAFIFAALNTLTVTYYLAIDKYPTLKAVFPSFLQYVTILVGIGIPILVFVGYVHYKKSSAYKAEADITIESHPHFLRMMNNIELLLLLNLKTVETLVALSKNKEISQEELEHLMKLKKELSEHISERKIGK
jgi:amino acid permease